RGSFGRLGDPIEQLGNVLSATLSRESQIVLELSGGVESTALAIALHYRGLHKNVMAVTYYDPMRSSSNEVDVAAKVAAACGLKHETFPLLEQLPFAPTAAPPLVSRPSMDLCFLAHFDGLMKAGFMGGDITRVNGHGGDAVFLAPPPFGAPLDALSKFRVIRAITALRDLAFTYRIPFWLVIHELLRDASRYLSGYVGQRASPSIVPTQTPVPTGLYDDILCLKSLKLKPARRCQIATIGATIEETANYLNAFGKPEFRPFLSQPMVEWALRAHPEDFYSGYMNRLPIRQSAYGVKPLSNLWRTDKGDTTHSTLLGLLKHKHHVMEVCLEGRCVADGYLERAEMEKLLRRAMLGHAVGLPEITRVFSIEMFLRGAPCH
ncbi:MAG TPA: asparagine synthase-related protein, partial [Trinickia sp.]|nr:asparagine synthase-related protein [Trinickia sp.]